MTCRLASIVVVALLLVALVATGAAAQAESPALDTKEIQVKAEIFYVQGRAAQRLGIRLIANSKNSEVDIGSQSIAKLMEAVRQSADAEHVGEPIISTLDGRLAIIRIATVHARSDSQGPGEETAFSVLPRVLTGGTISLDVKLRVGPKPRPILGQRPPNNLESTGTVKDGDTFVAAKREKDGRILLVAVTASIIPDEGTKPVPTKQ